MMNNKMLKFVDLKKEMPLKRETKKYQDLINAQTERLTFIKNQIDLELQKHHEVIND